MGEAARQRARVRLRGTWGTTRFLVVLLFMGLAAINYQSNGAWMLAFLVAGIAAVSLPHATRNLARVTLEPAMPEAFAGDPIALPVLLRNAAAEEAHAVEVGADVALAASTPAVTVPGGGAAVANVLLAPRRRGRFTVAGLRGESGFPFGVVRALVDGPALEAIVYPRPEGAPLQAVAQSGGAGSAAGGGEGDDFAGHRRPQPGDPQRRIDWKAVARGRAPLVKVYSGGESECRLAWEDTAGEGEARLSQLARWVLDAEAAGMRYGLALPDRELPAARGPEHRARCLRALALHVLPEAP